MAVVLDDNCIFDLHNSLYCFPYYISRPKGKKDSQFNNNYNTTVGGRPVNR